MRIVRPDDWQQVVPIDSPSGMAGLWLNGPTQDERLDAGDGSADVPWAARVRRRLGQLERFHLRNSSPAAQFPAARGFLDDRGPGSSRPD